MHIGQLTDEQRIEYGRMFRYAFDSAKNNYKEIQFPEPDMPADWLHGISDETGLLCAATVIDFTFHIRDRKMKGGGIACLTTRPEQRNRRLIRRLMDHIFQHLRSQQVAVAVGYPFKFSYWEAFGFRLADENVLYQWEITSIIPKPVEGRHIREALAITPDIRAVYDECAGRHNFIACRSDFQWKWIAEADSFKFVCYDAEDRPTGYVLLSFMKNEPLLWPAIIHDPGRTFYVREAFWRDSVTRQAILNLLWSHRDQRRYAAWSLPVNFNLIDHLDNPRVLARTVRPNAMIRLVDAPLALRSISYPLANFRLVIRIHDATCQWNEGTFAVMSEQDTVTVVPAPAAEPDLACSVGELGQLLAGFRTAAELHDGDKAMIRPGVAPLLADLFPPRCNYLRDFF